MTSLSAEVLASLSTPDGVEAGLGRFEFTDGAPARKTVEVLYDHLDSLQPFFDKSWRVGEFVLA